MICSHGCGRIVDGEGHGRKANSAGPDVAGCCLWCSRPLTEAARAKLDPAVAGADCTASCAVRR